jgi:uncharacterized RDD family membrane protein YckC
VNLEIYKTALRRFFAIFIDGLVFVLPMYFDSIFTTPETPAFVAIFGLSLSYSLSHCYSIILHTYFGQTVGKMIMKVRVFDVNGNPLTLKRAFLRDFPILILNVGFLANEIHQILTTGIDENFRGNYFSLTLLLIGLLWIFAEIIVMFSNEKRRAIHDYIAGTVVVKTNL